MFIDKPIIVVTEWLVRKVQDLTGIPKWRMMHASIRIWAVMETIRCVAERRWLWIIWCMVAVVLFSFESKWKRAQEEADRKQMIVPNRFRSEMSAVLIRLMNLIPFVLWNHLEVRINLIDHLVFVATLYLVSIDTFPILRGPTLKEKMRNLFRHSQVVEAKGET